MTIKEADEIASKLTEEKFLLLLDRLTELTEKELEPDTEEYNEMMELYQIVEAYQYFKFLEDHVHISELKYLLWSYAAIIVAIFSILFAIFLKK
jgi:hypothetical protein